jgi:Lipocalin-like domain
VSATLGDSARPPVLAGDPQSGTDDDYQKMARHFIAYAGPFSADAAFTATIDAPYGKIDIADWLRTLPDREYQRCAGSQGSRVYHH